MTILASALIAGYESVAGLVAPRPVAHLGAVVAASIVGFAGNEAVAIFRIRVGRQIGSAALVADGYHARADGLTSLAVLGGAAGVRDVADVRGRRVGHRLCLELNVAVDADLTVAEGHAIAKEVRHQILHHLPHASRVMVHVDPADEVGEACHRIEAHAHDGLPVHGHA